MILGERILENISTITIYIVLLAKGLKHNLLSISQLCIKELSINFDTLGYTIEQKVDKKLVFKDYQIEKCIYA